MNLKKRPLASLQFDVATAISIGMRDFQEDAFVADFSHGSELGFAVLADGMGGHAAGDVASKIVVTEVFSELKLQSGDPKDLEENLPDILLEAAASANNCVRYHAESNPETAGMGATLVAPVLFDNRLYWISIGDSLLFLFRDGKMTRLNEDHSMAPQIDYLVRSGLMETNAAINHPDRNCLTSVLIGEKIPRIDCPTEPVRLIDGDIVVVASDGLQFLNDEEIAGHLKTNANRTSTEITEKLMQGLEDLAHPDQDNTSLCVIKVRNASAPAVQYEAPAESVSKETGMVVRRGRKDKVIIMTSASRSGIAMSYRMTSEKSA